MEMSEREENLRDAMKDEDAFPDPPTSKAYRRTEWEDVPPALLSAVPDSETQ